MAWNRKSSYALSILSCLLGACEFHGERDLHHEDLTIEQVPEALTVDVGSGDVSILGANVTSVTVAARIQGPLNHVSYDLGGGRLTIFDECNEDPCGVDLTLLVPAQTPLTLRTGSGDVRLENLRAQVALETGSGDVAGSALSGLDLSAETGSGDVALEVLPRAERVHVRTGSGDVALSVPSGRYRIAVSTGSGDQELAGVSDDASAPSAIEVTTGSGDVAIRGR